LSCFTEYIPVSKENGTSNCVIKHNISQRESGGQISSFERINVILEFCVTNDITFAR